MESYYKRDDLLKFEEIGKEAPELAKKFFEY
ncbi:MAG: 4-carboxymuconolactone decarboxylase, partial [Deltaproteobacteria bacterium]|nr:4-carboxymuconolactone decarboxylase [Deltaproteobacteria bacterium]